MTSPGREGSAQILDFSLAPRDMLALDLVSQTLDPTSGLPTTIVESGIGREGIQFTVTTTITYTDGLPSQVTILHQGGGPDRTETTTINRDGDGNVTSAPTVRT